MCVGVFPIPVTWEDVRHELDVSAEDLQAWQGIKDATLKGSAKEGHGLLYSAQSAIQMVDSMHVVTTVKMVKNWP